MMKQTQSGSLLVEMAIALLLASLLAVWAGHKMVQSVEDTLARSTGEWFLAVKNAVDQLIAGHYNEYAEQTIVLPNISAWQPTIADLKTLGHLPPSFPEKSPMQVGARIRIERSLDTCPGKGCRIEGLIYSDQVIKRPTSPSADLDLVAAVVEGMGGSGGAVWLDDPNMMKGSQFKQANPQGNQVGIVGIVSMLDSTMFRQFVRMQDDRNPDFQGNISVKGGLQVQRIALQEIVMPNTSCTPLDISENGSPAMAQVASTAQGGLAVCVSGKWQSLSTMVTAFQPCAQTGSPEGALGQNADGVGMICRDGIWSPIAQHISRFILMVSQVIPSALQNAVGQWDVTKPVCGVGAATGVARIVAIPQVVQPKGNIQLDGSVKGDNMDMQVHLTLDAWQFQILDYGTFWRVQVPGQSQMLANVYCVY